MESDRESHPTKSDGPVLNEFYLPNAYIDTDMQIPMCLTGFSVVDLAPANRNVRFVVLGSVIPNQRGSEIVLTTLSKWHWFLDHFLNTRTWHNLAILSLVESWMIYGSDNWYMDPTVYDQIPNSIKDRMKADYVDFEKSVTTQLPYSIFRAVRENMISDAEELIAITPDLEDLDGYRKLLEAEKRRILFL